MDCLIPLVEEMFVCQNLRNLYIDNVACCADLTLPSGSWKTRHLRLRGRNLQEKVEAEQVRLHHLGGQFMLADLQTKPLSGPRVRDLLGLMGFLLTVHGNEGCGGEERVSSRLNSNLGERPGSESPLSGGSSAEAYVRALATLVALCQITPSAGLSATGHVTQTKYSAWLWSEPVWLTVMWCIISLVAVVRRRWCDISKSVSCPCTCSFQGWSVWGLMALRACTSTGPGSELRLLQGIRVLASRLLIFDVWAASVQPSVGQPLELDEISLSALFLLYLAFSAPLVWYLCSSVVVHRSTTATWKERRKNNERRCLNRRMTVARAAIQT